MSDEVRIELLPDSRITTARKQYNALRAALASAARVEIDGSGVVSIDLTGLQIILSALKTARARNVRLEMSAMSQPLRDAFMRAGLPAPSAIPQTTQA